MLSAQSLLFFRSANCGYQKIRDSLPLGITLILVLIGVPLFLRSPLWCDITLYDVAARNILTGGTHYRDVFDTNTPGYVWLLAGIRTLVGWSSEALLLVDLLFVTGILFLLDRLARWGGAGPLHRRWLLAGSVGFYLFTHEMIHAQRDVWLTLPALAAVSGRLIRILTPGRGMFAPAFVEGLLWGIAVWIKPHFLLVAAGVWLITVRRLAGVERPWRTMAVDLTGNLLAGSLLGMAGVGYLMASGTWPHFLDVMTTWNVEYTRHTFETLDARLDLCVAWFPPWTFLLPPTVMLALLGLIDGRVWSGRFRDLDNRGPVGRWLPGWLWANSTDQERFARAVIGAVYLLWIVQSHVLQRPFIYAHAIEVLLSLAVWAGYRWNISAVVAMWLLMAGIMWAVNGPWVERVTQSDAFLARVFSRHPIDRQVWSWPKCFRQPTDPIERWQLQDDLRHLRAYPAAIGWVELHEVAEFLRPQKVSDHELLCWNDSTHPLYLMLDVRPGVRFLHVSAAQCLNDHQVREEAVANRGVRFAVIDLCWHAVTAGYANRDGGLYDEPGDAANPLPPRMPPNELADLPFSTSRPVFRSDRGAGRYVVFALK
jgi:hypothetical protein